MRTLTTRTGLAATAAAIVLSAGAGCATSYRSGSAGTTAALPGTPACFLRRNFLGNWTVLSNSTLIFYTYPRDREAYLIRLQQPVVGLNLNVRLGLYNVQPTGQICSNLGTYLLVPGYTPSRILITDVRKLTNSERDQLLAQAGHPSPHREASNASAEPN